MARCDTRLVAAPDLRWNLNIHCHPAILGSVPTAATTALDVGCGDGLLTFDLAARGLRVVGIDPHAPSIERATADPLATERSVFVNADFFTHPLEPESFDVIASNAMLHHVDATRALRRMKELVRPGGVVAIVGFARPSGLADHARSAAGVFLKHGHKVSGDYWEHNAPTSWPPPLTMKQMASLGSSELPRSTFRRLLSKRYALIWHAPN